MLPLQSYTNKLYLATDEKNRNFFKVFLDNNFDLYFYEDLPQDILRPYLDKFPKRMEMDVLGIVEQFVCTYARYFLGSGYSTFTTYILRLRQQRRTLGADTRFSVESGLGLPAVVRELKSTCDPLKSLTHSSPC